MKDKKSPAYGESVWLAFRQAVEQIPDRLDGETLDKICAKLLDRNAAQQALVVRNSGLAGRLQVCYRLVEIAEECRFTDPDRLLKAAQAAVVVAAALGDDETASALVYDARAEAWACLANGRRIHGDLLGAQRAWTEVPKNLDHGSGDPLLRARLFSLEGALRNEQQQYDEARRLFERAQALYESIEDRHLAGRMLLNQGHSAYQAGDLDRAIQATLAGGKRIDCDRDPVLRAIALFNLTHFLGEAGQPQEALHLLRATAPLYDRLPNSDMYRLRLRWMEARFQAALGLPDDAARALEGVRSELLARELTFEAALASLDLAAVYAELGQSYQVAQLAREMFPVFASSKIPREASAALLLFAQAAREQELTAAAIRATVTKLRRQQ